MCTRVHCLSVSWCKAALTGYSTCSHLSTYLLILFVLLCFASKLMGWKESFEEIIIVVVFNYLCVGGRHFIPQLENWLCRLDFWVSFFLFRKKQVIYFPIFFPMHHLSSLHFRFHIVFAIAIGYLVFSIQSLYLYNPT